MLLIWWHSYLWQSSWQTASKQTSEIWVQAQNMTPRVPPYTFASCRDGNWSFEAMFAQRHSSQAIHNIGWVDSHSNAQKVCSNILTRGFSLNVWISLIKFQAGNKLILDALDFILISLADSVHNMSRFITFLSTAIFLTNSFETSFWNLGPSSKYETQGATIYFCQLLRW